MGGVHFGKVGDSRIHLNKSEQELLLRQCGEKTGGNVRLDKPHFIEMMKKVLAKTRWNRCEILMERLFNAFDADHSNSIEFLELVRGMSVVLKGSSDEKLDMSFRIYDLDGDGYVTRVELLGVIKSMYQAAYGSSENVEELVNRVFMDIDENSDGQLDFEEFKLYALREPFLLSLLDGIMDDHSQNHSQNQSYKCDGIMDDQSASYKSNSNDQSYKSVNIA